MNFCLCNWVNKWSDTLRKYEVSLPVPARLYTTNIVTRSHQSIEPSQFTHCQGMRDVCVGYLEFYSFVDLVINISYLIVEYLHHSLLFTLQLFIFGRWQYFPVVHPQIMTILLSSSLMFIVHYRMMTAVWVVHSLVAHRRMITSLLSRSLFSCSSSDDDITLESFTLELFCWVVHHLMMVSLLSRSL